LFGHSGFAGTTVDAFFGYFNCHDENCLVSFQISFVPSKITTNP